MGVADRNFSRLFRQEWDDYIKRIGPSEADAKDFALSDKPIQEGLAMARENTGIAFDNARLLSKQSLASYGVSQTARQKTADDKSLRLSEAATTAKNVNSTRQHVKELQDNLLVG